jgi:probable RNA-binding protein EIF1AD
MLQVEYPDGVTTLCMMPARFNRKLWVKRGGFLIIESSPQAQQDKSSCVTGTICAVLYEEHIKQLKKMPGVW